MKGNFYLQTGEGGARTAKTERRDVVEVAWGNLAHHRTMEIKLIFESDGQQTSLSLDKLARSFLDAMQRIVSKEGIGSMGGTTYARRRSGQPISDYPATGALESESSAGRRSQCSHGRLLHRQPEFASRASAGAYLRH